MRISKQIKKTVETNMFKFTVITNNTKTKYTESNEWKITITVKNTLSVIPTYM